MWMRWAAVLLGALLWARTAEAQEFTVTTVPAALKVPLDQLKPNTIIFSDHRDDEGSENIGGFITFDDWSRLRPLQKHFLSLYPEFTEGMTTRTSEGMTATTKEKLDLYTAEARFIVSKPASSIDLKRYATLAFLEKMDPQVKHQIIAPNEIKILNDERNANNRNPKREWCQGEYVLLCLRSRYRFEGKIPMGIALANKLRDADRKLDDFIEFENELRVLPPEALDEAAVRNLTGIDSPVTAMLEQSIFAINEVMHFGKFIAVIQAHPKDPEKTVATGMLVLAVSARTLDMKRKYEDVPVLRNLVPAQVLLGNSSFNTGNSISAGLPVYAHNRIKGIAEVLSRD